jgi:hypothetical protein
MNNVQCLIIDLTIFNMILCSILQKPHLRYKKLVLQKNLTSGFHYNIVTCFSDYRQGFGLVNRFIDHLQVVATNNYNSIANFNTTNHLTLSLIHLLSVVFTW